MRREDGAIVAAHRAVLDALLIVGFAALLAVGLRIGWRMTEANDVAAMVAAPCFVVAFVVVLCALKCAEPGEGEQ